MYEIEKVNNRYVVWRLANRRKLRQGSFATEAEALKRMEDSRKYFMH